jgi:hypothetical protein
MSKIKSIRNAIQGGREAYRDYQSAKKEALRQENSEIIRKHNEAMRIQKYGSLENAARVEAEQERLRGVNARYEESIAGFAGRVGLITNFKRDGTPDAMTQKLAQAAAGRVQKHITQGGVIVVEALIGRALNYRLDEFEESRDILAEKLRSDEVTVNTDSFVHDNGQLKPFTVLDRVEQHQNKYDNQKIAYIGLTSALQVQGLGLDVEILPFLGAHGDVYEAVVDGQLLVPGSENPRIWEVST